MHLPEFLLSIYQFSVHQRLNPWKYAKKITPPPNLKITQYRGGRYRLFSGPTVSDYSHSTSRLLHVSCWLENKAKITCKQPDDSQLSPPIWGKFDRVQESLFLHRCEAPPKLSATQTYGQGPAGTLTIGFEEQVKVWLARHGSRCPSSTPGKCINGPIWWRYGLDDLADAATPPSLAKSVSKLVDGWPSIQILSEALSRC